MGEMNKSLTTQGKVFNSDFKPQEQPEFISEWMEWEEVAEDIPYSLSVTL